jgi:hypothetical protein
VGGRPTRCTGPATFTGPLTGVQTAIQARTQRGDQQILSDAQRQRQLNSSNASVPPQGDHSRRPSDVRNGVISRDTTSAPRLTLSGRNIILGIKVASITRKQVGTPRFTEARRSGRARMCRIWPLGVCKPCMSLALQEGDALRFSWKAMQFP